MMRSAVLVAAVLVSFSEGASVDVKSVISTAKKLRTQAQARVSSLFGSSPGGGGAAGECFLEADKIGEALGATGGVCAAASNPITTAQCQAVVDSAFLHTAGNSVTEGVAIGLEAQFFGTAGLPSSTTWQTKIDAALDTSTQTGLDAFLATVGQLAKPCSDKEWASDKTKLIYPDDLTTESDKTAAKKKMVCECHVADDKIGARMCFDAGDAPKCHKKNEGSDDRVVFAVRTGGGESEGTHIKDLSKLSDYWGLNHYIKESCKTEFATPAPTTADATNDRTVTTADLKSGVDAAVTAWKANADSAMVDAIAAWKAAPDSITKDKQACYFNYEAAST